MRNYLKKKKKNKTEDGAAWVIAKERKNRIF